MPGLWWCLLILAAAGASARWSHAVSTILRFLLIPALRPAVVGVMCRIAEVSQAFHAAMARVDELQRQPGPPYKRQDSGGGGLEAHLRRARVPYYGSCELAVWRNNFFAKKASCGVVCRRAAVAAAQDSALERLKGFSTPLVRTRLSVGTGISWRAAGRLEGRQARQAWQRGRGWVRRRRGSRGEARHFLPDPQVGAAKGCRVPSGRPLAAQFHARLPPQPGPRPAR